jgi:hypothetical protein
VLYHALQVIPLIAAGLALELRLVLGREGDLAAPATATGDPATSSALAPPLAEPPAASAPQMPS